MSSPLRNPGSPQPKGSPISPGESARRSPSARGSLNAPSPNNRMPAPAANRRHAGESGNGRSRSAEQAGGAKGRNPVGSPPPNQRNSQQPRRSPQRKGDQTRGRSSQQRMNDQSNVDDAARAALALAAVAQAASASNKSPAEAAEIAKAQAHHIAKKQISRRQVSQQARPEPRKIQSVNLESVKGMLRSELAAGEELKQSKLLSKLADGGNDAFLQHLLLVEYLRAETDEGDDLNASLSQMEDMKSENVKNTFACDRVKILLEKAESAFDSLDRMMPSLKSESEEKEYDPYSELDDVEAPRIVPDLLPPCTSKPGDATLEFFKACMGDNASDVDHQAETETVGTIDESARSDHYDLNAESVENKDAFVESQEDKQGTSMFSSMFSMKRPAFNRKGIAAVFGKKRRGGKNSDDEGYPDASANCEKGEYTVQIEREMLGLTVENVLERTVVRTVLPGGPAKKAGAKVGSLIVKVGNIETKNLTHFETIDELRQSQRPLQLVLRQISDEALRSAREEMGRLIRGSGFGKIFDGEPTTDKSEIEMAGQRLMVGGDKNIDVFTAIMRKRWVEAANQSTYSKKDEPILRVGEKLVWILTLFIVGLEREADKLLELSKEDDADLAERSTHSQYQHTSKDFSDAAKSVSKILFDFLKKRMDPQEKPQPPPRPPETGGRGIRGGRGRGRGGRAGRGMTMVPGVPDPATKTDEGFGDKLLLQIGDVLQRTRSFLADPTSPPAAMLRGEVIACLCDILDADSEMKLSEEETASQTQGGKAGPITDLGSAGSLLKLIVLNCPIMRSPGCEEISKEHMHIDEDELKRRFGEKKAISGSDFHRLHAGNRFLAVVHRLAASRSTSARITACSLGPVLWSHLDFPHQLQLRGVITRALHDVEVIVRKSTATVLHEIAELVFDPRCVPWLVLMCERAMTDPEPLLRSAAMTLTWHLADHLPNAFLGDASKGSRYLRRLPNREDPIFPDVYLLQCKLLPVATRLAEDRAPQVRLAVAAQCDRLCDALGDHWSSVIIDVLVALLTDSDERVRSEAVMCVPRLADVVLLSSPPGVIPAGESSVLDALLPAAIKLQKDSSAAVRVSLATSAGEMLTLLVGLQRAEEVRTKESEDAAAAPSNIRFQKRHVDERLIPLVQKLLHDSDPEVTSSALRAVTNASRGASREIRARVDTEDDDTRSISSHQSHISIDKKDPVFLPVLSEEQVLRLLPTLSELANSKQWRVRQSAVEIVPALLGCTTKFETRAEIARLCIRLTGDKVDAVRKTAAECLCLGGGSLGSHAEDLSGEWITALVIPQIQACSKHTDYRQRLLCLKMVEVILLNDVCPSKWKDEEANADGKNSPLRELLKVTLSLAEDRIANVRLNVGKVLGTVIHVFGEQECRVIKYALLQQLKKENSSEQRQDRDVIFFATKCLDKLRQKLISEAGTESAAHSDENRLIV